MSERLEQDRRAREAAARAKAEAVTKAQPAQNNWWSLPLAIAFLVFVGWFLFGSRTPRTDSVGDVEVSSCVVRGITYFNEIGSFPTLSDGRDAEMVATERCRRTTTAFP